MVDYLYIIDFLFPLNYKLITVVLSVAIVVLILFFVSYDRLVEYELPTKQF
jgi:hypothetical protein